MPHPQITILRLIGKTQPRPAELRKVDLHSITVRKRLNKSFDLKRFIKIGSHSHGTAIRSYSDMDFLSVLAQNEAKWGGRIINSSTFLVKVRDDLNDRYSHTDVRRDMQAVVINFGNGQHSMDVVPAVYSRFLYGRPVYWIPDGNGDWIETSPESHNSLILTGNKQSGGKLIKTLQLLKWWKECRSPSIPIQSFHLDMLIASSDICIGTKSYTRCLFDAFQLLAERECRGFRDPLGIAGIIPAVNTDSQLDTANGAIDYALMHAKEALIAESWKDYEEANRQWDIVFNGQL